MTTAETDVLSDDQARRFRADGPAFVDQVYLNSARVSPYAAPVHDAFVAAEEDHYRGRWDEARNQASIDDARRELGALLGAPEAQVVLTQSATHSVNQLVRGMGWRAGDNVVWSALEYRSIAHTLMFVRDRYGVELRQVPAPGLLHEAGAFSAAVDARTRLAILPMTPVFCGVVQPVEAIGAALRGSDALYAVNATQAVGRLPIDVAAIGCDALFGTSRKWLRGPRGLGFSAFSPRAMAALETPVLGYPSSFWARGDVLEPGAGAERFQAGDYPYPSVVALAAAAAYASRIGVTRIAERNRRLATSARAALAAIPGVTVHDRENGSAGTVPITVEGRSPEEVVAALDARGIRTCTLDAPDARTFFDAAGLRSLVRVSVHYPNLPSDLDALVEAVGALA